MQSACAKTRLVFSGNSSEEPEWQPGSSCERKETKKMSYCIASRQRKLRLDNNLNLNCLGPRTSSSQAAATTTATAQTATTTTTTITDEAAEANLEAEQTRQTPAGQRLQQQQLIGLAAMQATNLTSGSQSQPQSQPRPASAKLHRAEHSNRINSKQTPRHQLQEQQHQWKPCSTTAMRTAARGRSPGVAMLLVSVVVCMQVLLGAHRQEKSGGLILGADAQQYRPDWPNKLIQQEIFLLNLEDGYFGCQVNESQDFLQLFELSRLCDGQAQCYRGTDEIVSQLKCNQRDQCGFSTAISGGGGGGQSALATTSTTALMRQEPIQCLNGVCLDGLCYCNDGWGGKSCDVPDENECKYRPCDVFAHCTNTMGSYYCSCFPGYDGDGMHCQDINECEIPSLAALCSDNSECCNLPGHFVCKCKPGYQQLAPISSSQQASSLTGAPSGNTSVSCTDIDECQDERACGKGAICENLPGSFRCACPPGFTGDPTLECLDMDECRTNPCGPGAQCTNIPGGYKCSCAAGFERNPLLPAGMFNQMIHSSQQAEMAALLASVGPNNATLQACLDINECLTPRASPIAVCGSGAQCINTPGGYFCQCPPNYTGNPKLACQDIDECSGPQPVCGPNSQCKNAPGSYKCECKQGYTGNAYLAEGCQDEDECLRKDACGLNGQCFNTAGSYQCSCQSGYTGDPYTKCLDIDECAARPPNGPCGPGAQCVNLAGGYKCACPDKFLARGSPDMGCERAAVDVGCSADYDCTQNAVCFNSTCECKLGYQASGTECLDVDECSLSQALSPPQPLPAIKPFTKIGQPATNRSSHMNVLCGPEALCYNTDGAYRCDCKPGYEKIDPLSASSKCRDLNECETDTNPCGQNSKCSNTDGSFKCTCNEGFIAIDGDPLRGCKSPCDGVNCGQHAACKPHGEEAACVCKPGFTFDPNNIKLGCVDINECDVNYGPAGLCGQRAVCTNVPGSYRCHCPSGYIGDAYRYCEDINECDRKFGVFGQCGELAVCNNTAGSFNCSCAPGYAGDPKVRCSDIDECSTTKFGPTGKCGEGALCSNTPGAFSCRCPAGYTGDPYQRCEPERPACQANTDCPTNQVCQTGRCHCPFSAGQDSKSQLQECRHPCDKTECGPNASCQLDGDNQALCVCEPGYMTTPSEVGRTGCVDINECIQGLTLTGVTPLAGRGPVAMGPSTGAQGAAGNMTGGHPCGKNALCRNQPGSFDCVCPPGHSGNAYEACTLEVRNQQQQTTPMPAIISQTTVQQTGDAGSLGNYQQEPRTTACSEPCLRNQVCLDGQCVRADSCRDNQDCGPTMACQQVNQVLGFQCVSVCEPNVCGPEAKCTPLNHRAVCSCSSGAGNPYDLVRGCQQLVRETTPSQLERTSTVSSSSSSSMSSHSSTLSSGYSSSSSSSDHLDSAHRTNLASQQPEQVADLTTTVAFGGGQMTSGAPYQQPALQLSPGSANYTTTNAQQTKKPVQVDQSTFFGYELPLPTTPLLPFSRFNSNQQQSTTTIQQQQQADSNLPTFTTQSPSQSIQTTLNGQSIGSKTTQKQQQEQATTQTTKRKPVQQQQQQQLNAMISLSQQQLNSANRQDGIDQSKQQQQQFDESSYSQFDNKSAVMQSSYYKQSTCSSDQHCPGNLYCLSSEQALSSSSQLIKSNHHQHHHSQQQQQQKLCGCPHGYRREADYCYLQRVNCSTSAVCKAREECISGSILQQFYGQQQQFTDGSQHFDDNNHNHNEAEFATGICICPRGYKLTASGVACIDRNECDEGTPCAVGAVCQNKVGSYECVCPPGTVGEPYTKTCEPIVSRPPSGQLQEGHCQTNSDCANDRECDSLAHKCISPCYVCGPRATCTAANHVAICLCPPRYTGNAIDLVYGCQEPPQTTTLAATTSSSIITTTTAATPSTPKPAAATTSAVGVPFTTLLPATTTLAPSAGIESTTPELVEFRTIPPSELFVMCLADGIQVEVQLGGFDGIIYVKGHSQDPKCRKLVSSQNANEFVDFKVQFGHCDLIHRDGEAGFVLVIQKHPKLVTYRARAYHVKCVYNTGERTVTLGFNVSMITTSGTIANTGPPPTCLMSITSLEGREVTSAEIGQDLLLRVDVQPDSIYGGFARSCEAKTMDDEGEYQYEVTDANGCATDPSIFSDWKYDQQRKSLVARFNAFKFPSSNNLRFQCNIRVCFGSCPAVNCNGIDAYGKRRRRREAPLALEDGRSQAANLSSSSSEIGPDSATGDELIVSDAFKEGALREEIMVQSNAILTFDKKESPLPQLSPGPQVEDIEFVCLPQLGTLISIGLTLLLALLALGLVSSCWFLTRQQRQRKLMNGIGSSSGSSCGSSASPDQLAGRGPLPHPAHFPNPVMEELYAARPPFGPSFA